MRYRWLGTAGFEIISGSTSILVDPYLTRNPKARPVQPLGPEDLAHAGAVFLTHGHFEHTYDVPRLAGISDAPVYASPTVCASLAADLVDRVRQEVVIPHHHDDFYPPLSQAIDLEPFLSEMGKRHPGAKSRVPSINRLEEL